MSREEQYEDLNGTPAGGASGTLTGGASSTHPDGGAAVIGTPTGGASIGTPTGGASSGTPTGGASTGTLTGGASSARADGGAAEIGTLTGGASSARTVGGVAEVWIPATSTTEPWGPAEYQRQLGIFELVTAALSAAVHAEEGDMSAEQARRALADFQAEALMRMRWTSQLSVELRARERRNIAEQELALQALVEARDAAERTVALARVNAATQARTEAEAAANAAGEGAAHAEELMDRSSEWATCEEVSAEEKGAKGAEASVVSGDAGSLALKAARDKIALLEAQLKEQKEQTEQLLGSPGGGGGGGKTNPAAGASRLTLKGLGLGGNGLVNGSVNRLTGRPALKKVELEDIMAQSLVEAARLLLECPSHRFPGQRALVLAAVRLASQLSLDPTACSFGELIGNTLKVPLTKSERAGEVATAGIRTNPLILKAGALLPEVGAVADEWLKRVIEAFNVHVIPRGDRGVIEATLLAVGEGTWKISDFVRGYKILDPYAAELLDLVFSPSPAGKEQKYPYTDVLVMEVTADGVLRQEPRRRVMALLVAVMALTAPARVVGKPITFREAWEKAQREAGATFPWALGPGFAGTLRKAADVAFTLAREGRRPGTGETAWGLLTRVGDPLLSTVVGTRLLARANHCTENSEPVANTKGCTRELMAVWESLVLQRDTLPEGSKEETMAYLLSTLDLEGLITFLQWIVLPIDVADGESAAYMNFFKEKVEPVAVKKAQGEPTARVLAMGAVAQGAQDAGAQGARTHSQTCFGCKKEGHVLALCPLKKTTGCFKCGQQGHFGRDCTSVGYRAATVPAAQAAPRGGSSRGGGFRGAIGGRGGRGGGIANAAGGAGNARGGAASRGGGSERGGGAGIARGGAHVNVLSHQKSALMTALDSLGGAGRAGTNVLRAVTLGELGLGREERESPEPVAAVVASVVAPLAAPEAAPVAAVVAPVEAPLAAPEAAPGVAPLVAAPSTHVSLADSRTGVWHCGDVRRRGVEELFPEDLLFTRQRELGRTVRFFRDGGEWAFQAMPKPKPKKAPRVPVAPAEVEVLLYRGVPVAALRELAVVREELPPPLVGLGGGRDDSEDEQVDRPQLVDAATAQPLAVMVPPGAEAKPLAVGDPRGKLSALAAEFVPGAAAAVPPPVAVDPWSLVEALNTQASDTVAPHSYARMLSTQGRKAPTGAPFDYGELAEQAALRGQDAWFSLDGDFVEQVNVRTVKPGGACVLVGEGPTGRESQQLLVLLDSGACTYLNGAGALLNDSFAGGANVDRYVGPEVVVHSATGVWFKSARYAKLPLSFHYSGEATEEELAGGNNATIRVTGGHITALLADAEQWGRGNLGPGVHMVMCPALFAPESKTPEADQAWVRDLWNRASAAAVGGARFRTHVVVTGGDAGEPRGGSREQTRVTTLDAFGDVPLHGAPPLGMFGEGGKDDDDVVPMLVKTRPGGRLPYAERPGIVRGKELLEKLNWGHLQGDKPHERAHRAQVQRLKLRERLEAEILKREVLFGTPQPGGPPIYFRAEGNPVRSGLRQRDPEQFVPSIYDQVRALEAKGMARRVAPDISVPGAVPLDHHVHPKVLAQKKVPAGAPPGTRPGIRMCLNAKELNRLIPEADRFKTVLPRTTEIRDAMLGGMLGSSLDQADAFNSRRIHPDCFKLFCFTAKNPDTGLIELWQFLCMIFGHELAPGLFHESQETMIEDIHILDALTALLLYLDDLGIVTKPSIGSAEACAELVVAADVSQLGAAHVSDEAMLEMFKRHLMMLCAVFDKMIEAEVSLNLSKCAFLQRKWTMLGLITDGRFYAVDPSRTQGFRALATVPAKLTLSWLRRTMGVLVAYKHTAGTAWGKLIEPLAELLTKATNEGRLAAAAMDAGRRQAAARLVAREWVAEQHGQALKAVVALLVANGIMALPDPSATYYADGDACDTGYGLKLSQILNGKEVVVDTFSIKFSPSQQKWSVAVRELYTQLQAARRWWRWLQGCKVVWRNDHHNLLEVKDLQNAFIARWVAELSLLPEWARATRVFAGGAVMSVVDKFSRDGIGAEAPTDYADGLLVPCTATRAIAQLKEAQRESASTLRLMVSNTSSPQTDWEVRRCLGHAVDLKARTVGVEIGRHMFGENLTEQWMLALTNSNLDTLEPLAELPLPAALTAAVKVHESVQSPLLKWVLKAQRALTKEQREALEKELGPHVRAHQLDEGEVLLYRGRVLVPREAVDLRNELMKMFHDPLHEHVEASLKRMHDAALHLVGGKEFATEYYRSCLPCQLARTPQTARQVVPMLLPGRPQKPLSEVTMDFVTIATCPTVVGSTTKGEQGEKGLFIIMCLATGYSWPFVVSSYSAKAACNGLEQWAGVFGYPVLVRVDGGSHFMGEFAKLCATHGVTIDRGTAHHHEGRGAIEASAKRYAEALRRLMPEGQQLSWPKLFPGLARLVNSVPGKTRMGLSPFELLFPGAFDPAEKLWGALPQKSLEEMTNFLVWQRELAGVALDFWTVVSKVRHDARLTPFNEVTGAFLPEIGEWVLLQNVLKASKMDPDYNGPYVVVEVETNSKKVPTGWVTVAEVLGGILPGQVGYPARGKSVVVVADRLWPFDPSRVTANDVMLWKLPEGWKVVMDVLSGPRARDGRFQVLWSHQTEPTWASPTEIWTAVPFRKYCEAKKISLKKLAADMREKWALPAMPAPKAAPVLAPPVVAAPGAPPAVPVVAPRETQARGSRLDTSAASVWYCPVCEQVVLPTEAGYVKRSHGKCPGSGKPATQG